MVQLNSRHPAPPTLAACPRLDALARSAVRGVLEPQTGYEMKGVAQVRAASGEAVYVVVVERTEEVLPAAAVLQRRYRLTQREAEVALLAGRRLSVAEMAESLEVTTHTVRRHIERVLAKLGVSRRQAVRSMLLAEAERQRRQAADVARLEEARRRARSQDPGARGLGAVVRWGSVDGRRAAL